MPGLEPTWGGTLCFAAREWVIAAQVATRVLAFCGLMARFNGRDARGGVALVIRIAALSARRLGAFLSQGGLKAKQASVASRCQRRLVFERELERPDVRVAT